jgi:nicotinamidase-related amidase
MPHVTQMSAGDTGLLVIDIQVKLIPKILGAARLVHNVSFLLDVAKLLQMPTLATEQYPRGLGGTVPELAPRLPSPPEKVRFSSCAVPSVIDTLHREARPRVVLCGIETHVCVLNTALDLLAHDFRVYLAVDALGARAAVDHDTALRRLEQAGAILTTVEGCAFEWLGGADHPHFKAISKMVQERMATLPG